MKNLLSPRWLLITNTLPLGILFILYAAQYNIIKSLLSAETLHHWLVYGGILAILGIATLIYALREKGKLSVAYAFISMLGYGVFLLFYLKHTSDIIPFDIPRWMIANEISLYLGTFLMPTLIHSLFIVVIQWTDEHRNYNLLHHFGAAIGVPLLSYLFFVIIFPMWGGSLSGVSEHIYTVLLMSSTVVFLFFLCRMIYIISIRKSATYHEFLRVWKIIFSLCSLLGLYINGYGFFNNIFGDFSSPWFYILALLNGILLLLKDSETPKLRLILYLSRCVFFAFICYFFIVFLPYLPFAMLAIIAFALGFLMLTPLILFILQINQLNTDFSFLTSFYSKKKLLIYSLSAFCTFPIGLTALFLYEKNVLHNALDYVFQTNFTTQPDINQTLLTHTLKEVKNHKENNIPDFLGNSHIPYISSYFNYLVLDNLTLSDAKINELEKVFFGASGVRNQNFRNFNNTQNVEISSVKTQSSFDTLQNAWRTQVDLSIDNQSDRSNSEFSTAFELPAGCWISDYYLYVGDKKEMGILSEKKAAMWVYNQITNTRRDPGILHYESGNKVRFQVFPFAENETRKTGIEFLHKEPVVIDLGGQKIHLGNPTQQSNLTSKSDTNSAIAYVSAKEKTTLTAIQRTPFYHFIIDISAAAKNDKALQINQIQHILSEQKLNTANAKITYCNAFTHSENLGNDWTTRLEKQPYKGGFFIEKAIKQALFDNFTSKKATFPIIIVVSNQFSDAMSERDFSDWAMTFPESDLFYVLNEKNELATHSLLQNPRKKQTEASDFITNHTVLAYPNAQSPRTYLPNDGKASIAYCDDNMLFDASQIQEKKWQSGLLLQGNYFTQVLHPERINRVWETGLRASFVSKIMSPLTAYMVVENEAQKAMLLKKQAQVINGNKNLDLGEEPMRADEPSLWLLLGLLGSLWWRRKLRI